MSKLSMVAVAVVALLVLFVTSAYAQETVTLTVTSAYGGPGDLDPSVGVHEYAKGTVMTASVAPYVLGGTGTRYACVGWKSKGSRPSEPGEIPAMGFTNEVTFTINSNVVLTWRWKAQYRLTLNVSPAGAGHIDFYCDSHPEEPAGTYPPTEGGYWSYLRVAQLTAVADEGYDFAYWSGGSQVLRLEPTKNPTVQKMRKPETITANFTLQQKTFTVISEQGEPDPAVGTYTYYYDETVTANCGPTNPYPAGEGAQYVCTGHDGTGDVSPGSEMSISFYLHHDSSVTWLWQLQYALIIDSPYGNPQGAGWHNAGTTASWSVTNPYPVSDGVCYFTDDQSSGEFPVDSPKSVTVSWRLQYRLITAANPPEFGTVTPSGETYHNENAEVSLTAAANLGYVFTNWSGDLSGATNPQNLTMDGPKSVTANFIPLRSFTVISAQGAPSPAVGTHQYNHGSTVTANCGATPYPPEATGTRYLSTGWTGGSGNIPAEGTNTSCTFTITQDCAITWIWNTQYELVVTTSPGSPTGAGWYEPEEQVTASVAPYVSAGEGIRYSCTGWTGTGSVPASGSGTSVTYAMGSGSSVTWVWVTQYMFVVPSNPSDAGTVDIFPSGTWFDADTVVQLTAIANEGWEFSHWSGDLSGTNNPETLIMDGPKTVTANFIPQPRTFTVYSAYGAPVPAVGTYTYYYDQTVTANCGPDPYPAGEGAQYVCIGHDGTGDVGYVEGETHILFVLHHDSSVTWLWQLYYAPVADFSATPTSGNAPLTVQFTDASTGLVTSWEWDFDNNGTVDSTEQNPSYTYANAGRYTVKLTVTGPGGSDTETKTDYIRVYAGIIYVDGSRPDDTGNGLSWATAKKLIQSGINAATNSWLVLVANGTYTGTGNKDLDFNGKAIHLKSVGGAANCIIDCQNSGRGFYFHTGETAFAVIEGFIIRNGNAADHGGGVYCNYSSSPTFTNCTISGNSAGNDGGGVYCMTSSNPTFTNCTISGNFGYYGSCGVVCYHSSPTFTNCTISGNWGYGNAGGVGCDYSNPTFTNCTISGNYAYWQGGGVDCSDSSSPTFTNCTISGNSARVTGGGVRCHSSSSATFRNSIIWGNTAGTAGHQIYTYDSSCSVTLSYSCYANGTNDVAGGGTVTPDNCINTNPLFVGGGDYHLQGTSPCIDRGNNSYVPAGVTIDLDGNPRILDGDNNGTATVDLGAYEYQP